MSSVPEECPDTPPQPLGPALAGLGLHIHLGPNDYISDAMVLVLVANPERREPAMMIATSQGLNWVTARGLIEEARDTHIVTPIFRPGE